MPPPLTIMFSSLSWLGGASVESLLGVPRVPPPPEPPPMAVSPSSGSESLVRAAPVVGCRDTTPQVGGQPQASAMVGSDSSRPNSDRNCEPS